jgi:hypothetical protein
MDRPEDARRLWAGLLAGPVGWFLAFLGVYAQAPGACGHHAGRLHGLILVGLIVAGAGTGLAWTTWKAAGGAPSPKDEGVVARARLLSTLGLLGGCLFSLLIVAQWLAVAMLTACEGV